MPTGGQAGRWQAIADTTTIGSSLVDLKEKGATPQDRRFLYVDCIKRTTNPKTLRGLARALSESAFQFYIGT